MTQRERLELEANHYHAGAVAAHDLGTEIHITGRDAVAAFRVTDLIVLTPAQASELAAWLDGGQIAIRDARIEELEARVAELELTYTSNGPAWDYGPGQPYHIPPEGDA